MPGLSPLHAGPAAGFYCGQPGMLVSMHPPRRCPVHIRWSMQQQAWLVQFAVSPLPRH